MRVIARYVSHAVISIAGMHGNEPKREHVAQATSLRAASTCPRATGPLLTQTLSVGQGRISRLQGVPWSDMREASPLRAADSGATTSSRLLRASRSLLPTTCRVDVR